MKDDQVPWGTVGDKLDEVARKMQELDPSFDAGKWSQQACHEIAGMGIERVAESTDDDTLRRLVQIDKPADQ